MTKKIPHKHLMAIAAMSMCPTSNKAVASDIEDDDIVTCEIYRGRWLVSKVCRDYALILKVEDDVTAENYEIVPLSTLTKVDSMGPVKEMTAAQAWTTNMLTKKDKTHATK